MRSDKKGKKSNKKTRSKSSTKGLSFKFWSQLSNWKYLLPIALLTFAAFYPSLENEFVNWDDDRNFYENQYVVDANWENFGNQIGKIFSSDVIGNYNPLTITTFLFEKLIFGFQNTMPWHLNNILLHILCTLLVFRLMQLLKVSQVVVIGVTLLFAVHPLRVESVAWVTERKDVLFAAFYLGAMINYIKYHRSKKQKKYLIFIFVLFILSLLSKIQAVTLPLSFLAIDYWRNRKMEWSLLIEKVPFFLLSIGFGVLGVFVLEDQGSLETNATFNLFQRLFVGSYSYMIYLVKSIVPFKMVPLYPYPETMPWYFYASMGLVPFYLLGFYYAWKRNMKAIVFGLAFFTFNIVFLLQILGAGQGFLADRFTYVAYIGLFFIVAYYFDELVQSRPQLKTAFYGIGAAVIIGFGFITFNQNKIWKNPETLWTHVLGYSPNITVPWGNRANYFRDTGRTQEALNDYSQVIRLAPNKPNAYNSRAKLYFNSGQNSDLSNAKRDYERALQLDPNNAEYRTNLGATFARLNQPDEAITHFTAAINLKPDHAVAFMNRSILFQQKGDFNSAVQDIASYLKLRPYHADLWYESGRLKRAMGQLQPALNEVNRAIQLDSKKGVYYNERSKVYFDMNQIQNARIDMQNAQNLGYNVDAGYLDQLSRS